jgi:hypothetical protein
MNLKDIRSEYLDSIQLTEDSVQWQALASTVLTFVFHKNR